MSGSLSHGANAEPNLTPMLDMVFQLITFFMLVINFKSASMDLNLKLPVVGSAVPVKGDDSGVLLLNINSNGELTIYNKPEKDIEGYIRTEASVAKKRAGLKPDEELPIKVVIRADKAVKFNLLNRVIKACQDNGYRSFSLKAMNKAA